MKLYSGASYDQGALVAACRVKTYAGNPCAGMNNDTPASQIPVKCLQDAWKSVGCTNAAFVPDNYAGWWKQDAPSGAGTFKTTVGNMRLWATSDDANNKKGCYNI
jgi:hypothetical protein